LLKGRDFSWRDDPEAPRAAIVSQNLAQQLFASSNALGQHIRVGTSPEDQDVLIIGVTSNIGFSPRRNRTEAAVYLAYLQDRYNQPYVQVRTRGQPFTVAASRRHQSEALGREYMYLFWQDLNPKLRTVRVLSKPDLKFFPKRWEEREVPVPVELAELLESHPVTIDSPFVFPSPTGNREQNFLRRCKVVAERAGLDPEEFDLKTFRSTYATSMLRRGFDVRTVQHWMGHKSLETTMRYLAPAPDVHDRLDLIRVPGARKRENSRKPPSSEGHLRNARRKPDEAR